jgi:hypothetical protein
LRGISFEGIKNGQKNCKDKKEGRIEPSSRDHHKG